ncbi:hypothetical protein L2E82_05809 [Cichorium intybus]|uniref:Uncharacterized protein n=1 Tax=Cichorium intybus TaxID=13427 RepID=A0ACB9H9F2_CICIN|nr:hypothetical protein L2E82_05809 [Cichorium intybus]
MMQVCPPFHFPIVQRQNYRNLFIFALTFICLPLLFCSIIFVLVVPVLPPKNGSLLFHIMVTTSPASH